MKKSVAMLLTIFGLLIIGLQAGKRRHQPSQVSVWCNQRGYCELVEIDSICTEQSKSQIFNLTLQPQQLFPSNAGNVAMPFSAARSSEHSSEAEVLAASGVGLLATFILIARSCSWLFSRKNKNKYA